MTIIFFSRLFYPHIGGVEKHVLEVGKRLIGKGHRVIVVTEYHSKGESDKLTGEVEGIEIHYVPVGKGQTLFIRHAGLSSISNRGWRFWMRSAYQNDGKSTVLKENWFKKFRIWWWLWQHRDLIKTSDIVHCHDVFFWYLPFRFLYPNRPVYTTFHGHETKFPPSKKAILIRKISEKLSWGNICVGDYIRKWYYTKPDYVTYGGIDINKIRNPKSSPRGEAGEIRNKFKIQNSKFKILLIGRLENDMGVSIYLETLKLLKERGVQFEFVVCGDGSLRRIVEKYGKFHGFVEDLRPYIEKADIVFASSYLSILQTLSQKKLVIAAYENPLKEDYLKMSPSAKWMIIENSPLKIVGKVLYFIKHQGEKEIIIDKGYQWVKTQTWERAVSLYLKLWGF